MKYTSYLRRHTRSLITALLLLACTAGAWATDTYSPANHQLTIPTVAIGNATYSSMVVTVGSILSDPTGISPNGSEDRYNPANQQLTVPAVKVGTSTYYNVVVAVADLVSIGGVTGVDT
jgi:hypothetical protein